MLFQAFLSFALFTLTMASPTLSTASHGDALRYGTGGGILGFVVLVLDILVWMEVLKSSRPPLHKVLWCVVVFIFPIVGLVVYWLFSNRAQHNSGSGYEAIA
ncbi:hypothetical protein LSUE1_G009448 [Lachnellula suecica]|uniref:Cardiolipin synthase N-terminal domain-containing protein n=1 Tax=Lachnellula suecica TaxID=602035 RepID=A0A8T9BQU1_9HELO|nr:hypothetical protein LSUE1_G009448 [Lachnellula suecica]